jgi:hypothetical protein
MNNIIFLVTSVRTDNETRATEIHTISHSSLKSVFETLNWFVEQNAIYTFTTLKIDYYIQAIKVFSVDPIVSISDPIEFDCRGYRTPVLKFTDRGTPIWDEENIFYKQYNDNKINEQTCNA